MVAVEAARLEALVDVGTGVAIPLEAVFALTSECRLCIAARGVGMTVSLCTIVDA